MANKKTNINYLNKDFRKFRENIIDYAKQYFPDTYNDFNEASPGMMFIEMAAYVGDVLSYYIDNNMREGLLEHAQEKSNVVDIARSMGYQAKPVVPSYATLDVFQVLPTVGSAGTVLPDWRYALKVDPGMVLSSTENTDLKFSSLEAIDFAASASAEDTQVSVYTIDDETGDPTSYLVKKQCKVVSGELTTETVAFTSPKKFEKVRLDSTKVIKIESVKDSDGNRWYEVPYLAQDTIFEEIQNNSTFNPLQSGSAFEVPYLLKLRRTARRFTTGLAFNNKTELKFGAGISTDPDELIVPNPETIGNTLARGPGATLDVSFDPANMMFTKAYGQAPANTTLTIKYLEGGGLSSNVGSGIINKIDEVIYSMDEDGLDGDALDTAKASIAVTNPFPATGGRDEETIEEIRQNALAGYASQNRVVTKEDYLARVYSMPPRFGSISKAYITQDDVIQQPNSVGTNTANPLALNLYILSYDENKNLTITNNTTKQNLRQYINQYRMLTDAINIRNGFVVNIGVDFDVLTLPGSSAKEVLFNVIKVVKDFFQIDKWQFNQPIMIPSLTAKMDQVDGVQTIANLTIKNNVNPVNGYAGAIYNIENATHNNIIYPSLDPMIWEIKYPDKDIRGKVIG